MEPIGDPPPNENVAGEDHHEPVNESIDLPPSWPMHYLPGGWIEIIDTVGGPHEWRPEDDVQPLPWQQLLKVDAAGGVEFPMIADDRWLRPNIDIALFDNLIRAHLTAHDAEVSMLLAMFNRTDLMVGDSAVPEPSTILLAFCGLAPIAATRRRRD
jgi:hypothetical protein